MRRDPEAFRTRIARARARVGEYPVGPESPPQARAVLRDAPALLDELERAVPECGPQDLKKMDEYLSRLEEFLEVAAGAVGGRMLADRFEASGPPDPKMPPQQRLSERLYSFVQRQLDQETFLVLIREWAGDDAVQGSVCVMDPSQIAPLSVWLAYDKVLPGLKRRAIDQFAEDVSGDLPEEEQVLLGLWRGDRPSLYRIDSVRPGEGYIVRDLLLEDTLRVRDRMSATTLTPGAVVLARFAPAGAAEDPDYAPLGTLSEVPAEIWPRLEEFVENHREAYERRAPQGTPLAFFREHHALIRRQLYQLAKLGC